MQKEFIQLNTDQITVISENIINDLLNIKDEKFKILSICLLFLGYCVIYYIPKPPESVLNDNYILFYGYRGIYASMFIFALISVYYIKDKYEVALKKDVLKNIITFSNNNELFKSVTEFSSKFSLAIEASFKTPKELTNKVEGVIEAFLSGDEYLKDELIDYYGKVSKDYRERRQFFYFSVVLLCISFFMCLFG